MDRILRFKPHLRVEHEAGRLFLIGERDRVLVPGPLHARVARLVDGRRSEWQIVQALEADASPHEVYHALRQLEAQGYLAEAVELAPEAAAFWYSLGIDAARAAERLAARPVRVLATGGEETAALLDALRGAGVEVGQEAATWTVVARDYLDGELAELNRRALAEGARWLLVKPSGWSPWIGPMFAPDGPCWECLAHRLRANRPVESFLARTRDAPLTPPRASLPSSLGAALSMASLALARSIVEDSVRPRHLLALDASRLHIDQHPVTRRPQCPACGDPELLARRAERPVVLASRPKQFSDDGGYRVATPDETFARHEHLISPLSGVVATVGPVPERDHPLRPVYRAAYFVCPPPDSALERDEFTRPSLGKGRTAAQARAGALCEAIERYSAIHQGDEGIVIAPGAELRDVAIPPPSLLHFSDEQYRMRDELNRGVDRARLVPLRFDERVPIGWAPAWSLSHQRRRYLPAAYCYLHAPDSVESRFCTLDPNGHAAGNCVEEAILQGFLELAERDAVAIWWYGRVRRPAVDLASFAEPYFLELVDHYRALGFHLWVLDLTNDLELPAFVALARDEDGRTRIGFGCHLEARLGVQRALTELNQSFDRKADRSPALVGAMQAIADRDYLFPDRGRSAPRRRDDFTTFDFARISRDDVRGVCGSRGRRAGSRHAGASIRPGPTSASAR